ncbi:hypothetical protein RRG08_010384 [Elysia crispata]|uniref:Uncharacterized protein n=1 Tax=Elysia crispata TaxID=231223 RepID=A0AAE1BAE0_9GAST|nr:hypothetical protein RRG08_010384 [Elysia crispata]
MVKSLCSGVAPYCCFAVVLCAAVLLTRFSLPFYNHLREPFHQPPSTIPSANRLCQPLTISANHLRPSPPPTTYHLRQPLSTIPTANHLRPSSPPTTFDNPHRQPPVTILSTNHLPSPPTTFDNPHRQPPTTILSTNHLRQPPTITTNHLALFTVPVVLESPYIMVWIGSITSYQRTDEPPKCLYHTKIVGHP